MKDLFWFKLFLKKVLPLLCIPITITSCPSTNFKIQSNQKRILAEPKVLNFTGYTDPPKAISCSFLKDFWFVQTCYRLKYVLLFLILNLSCLIYIYSLSCFKNIFLAHPFPSPSFYSFPSYTYPFIPSKSEKSEQDRIIRGLSYWGSGRESTFPQNRQLAPVKQGSFQSAELHVLSSFFQNHQSDITSPPLWRSPNNYYFLLSPSERSKAALLVLRLELVYWRITKNFQEVLLSQFLELQLPFVFLEICLPEKNISVLQILLKYFPVLKQKIYSYTQENVIMILCPRV